MNIYRLAHKSDVGRAESVPQFFFGGYDRYVILSKELSLSLNDTDFICLNSVTNVNQLLDDIQKIAHYQNVQLLLDGDIEGTQTTNAVKKTITYAKDLRNHFAIGDKYNDLNDFWIDFLAQKKQTPEEEKKNCCKIR